MQYCTCKICILKIILLLISEVWKYQFFYFQDSDNLEFCIFIFKDKSLSVFLYFNTYCIWTLVILEYYWLCSKHSFARRNGGENAPMQSSRQVTFEETERSFVTTKVQLAWQILQPWQYIRNVFCVDFTCFQLFGTHISWLHGQQIPWLREYWNQVIK